MLTGLLAARPSAPEGLDGAPSDQRLRILLGSTRMLLLGDLAMDTIVTTVRKHTTPRFIIGLLDNSVTLLMARIMVTAPFIAGGLTKVFDWHGGVAEMTHVGLHPAWAFNVAALGTQLIGSALIIVN